MRSRSNECNYTGGSFDVNAYYNNKTINIMVQSVTSDLSALASGLVAKNRALGPSALVLYFWPLDRKLVRTNPMLHSEPYINYYLCTEEPVMTAEGEE